jgi:hypothetical protein
MSLEMMVVWIGLSFALSSCATPLPPQLDSRTLRICPDFSGFCYQYPVCNKRFLGICTSERMYVEKIDFSDKEKIKELYDKRFVLKKLKNP